MSEKRLKELVRALGMLVMLSLNLAAGVSFGVLVAALWLEGPEYAVVFVGLVLGSLALLRCLGSVAQVLPFNRLLVWHKGFVNSAVAGPWRWDIVPVLLFGKATFGRPQGGSSVYHSDGHTRLDVGDHPSPLPLGLARWLIEPFPPESVILDPFMGSGAFIAAARQLGRRAIGIDIDESYCATAVAQCRQETLGLSA